MARPIDGQTVLFGATVADGAGAYCGSHVLTVNINTPSGFNTSASSTPFDVAWAAYDDDWAQIWCQAGNCETCEVYSIGFDCDGGVYTVSANAEGTATIADLSYYMVSEYHWNLRNLTTGTIVRETRHGSTGSDLYGGNSIEKASINMFHLEMMLTSF